MVGAGPGISTVGTGIMQWQDLISTSRLLTTTTESRPAPLPDSLRRAVSTAYYALFHALANSNADCLIGAPTDALQQHAWNRVQRGLDHSVARRNLEQDRRRFSQPVQEFIATFAALQNARHTADYDSSRQFTLTEAQAWIDQAEKAITDFMAVDSNERRAVAVQVLVRGRAG